MIHFQVFVNLTETITNITITSFNAKYDHYLNKRFALYDLICVLGLPKITKHFKVYITVLWYTFSIFRTTKFQNPEHSLKAIVS